MSSLRAPRRRRPQHLLVRAVPQLPVADGDVDDEDGEVEPVLSTSPSPSSASSPLRVTPPSRPMCVLPPSSGVVLLQQPSSCPPQHSLVVFDPSSLQLALYQRRQPASAAAHCPQQQQQRQTDAARPRKKRRHEAAPASASQQRASDAEQPALCPACLQPVRRAVTELRGGDAEAAEAVDAESAASARRQSVVPYQSADYFRLLAFAFEAEQRSSRADRQRLSHRHSSRRQQEPDERQQETEEGEDEEQEEVASADALMESPLSAVFSPSRLSRRAPALLPAPQPPQQQTTETESETEGGSGTARAAAAAASVFPSTAPRPPSLSSSSSSSSSACGGLHSSSFITGYYDRFFRKGRKLGGGAFGVVYFTSHVLEGVELGHYACKIVPVGDSKQWLLKVSAEIRALEAVHHRNIVSYRHSWLEEAKVADYGPTVPCLFVLMEYCNQGTVAELVWPKRRTAATQQRQQQRQQQQQAGRESETGRSPAVASDAASAAQSEDEGRAAAGRVKQARRRRRQRQAEQRAAADTEGLLAPRSGPSSPTASPQRSPPSTASASASSSRRRRRSTSPAARADADADAEAARSGASAAEGCVSGDGSVVYLLESDIWWLFLDCCLGLRHLHRCGVVHNDLKLENLLLTADADARGQMQSRRALISDMGNAIIKGEQHLRTGMTGTLQYAAPETLRPQEPGDEQPQRAVSGGTQPQAGSASSSSPYSEATDLWSLGVILFALCYSRLPFSPRSDGDSVSSMYAAIVSHPVQLPSHPRRSSELKALITRLLSVDPQHRPDCEQILSHPAIQRRREERRRREMAAAAASLSPYSPSSETESRRAPSPAPAAATQSSSEQPAMAAAAAAAAALSPVSALLPAASPTSSPLPAGFPPRLLLPSTAAHSEAETAVVPLLPVLPAAAAAAGSACSSSGLCFCLECAAYLCLLLLHQTWTVVRMQRLAVNRSAASASSPAELLWTLGRALSPAVLLSAATVYGAALAFQLRSQQTAEAATAGWRLSFQRSLAVRLSLAVCLHLLLYASELH